MIIDFHTHTFPESIAETALDKLRGASHTHTFTDGTNRGLKESMQRSGIDVSVILPVATAARQVIRINDTAVSLNEREQQAGTFPRLISFGGMHPDYEDYRAELARIREQGILGIKVHPVYQGIDIDDIRFLRIFDRCAELGLIVSAHSGFDIGIPGVNHCSPAMSAHVMKEIPSLCLILAHMGGWHIWDEVPAYLAGTGAYLDTSFSTGRFHPLADGYWNEEDTAMLNTEGFMRLVNAIGPDHILFGTDSPWSVPEESIAFIREAPLSEADKAAILGGTACRLLFKD